MWSDNILETIGETPLVKLNRITKGYKATILAKLEYMNPGGSIKDRMAIYMIREAEKRGEVKPGGTIVESTSGNTGFGIALYAAVKEYKIIFTIPDKMSDEKINLLRAVGAEVKVCPTAVPADSPESYYEVAKRMTKEIPGAYLLNQYHNLDNTNAHYYSTGPEIWEQTEHKIDYVVAGVGTGGTISGIGKFLKEKSKDIKIIGVDPIGSIYYDYFKHKKFIEPNVYMVEGIGEDMLCANVDFSVIDDMVQVCDKDCFLTARRLLKEEGIFAGGSSGAAVYGALKVAERLETQNSKLKSQNLKDIVIVAILPDSGRSYLSKFYNDKWMQEKHLNT